LRRLEALIVSWFLVAPRIAGGQGGPPLVTDDPDTPGDGHWETNLAGIGSWTAGHVAVDAPDVDLNYGWGDRVQLKVDIPLTFVRQDGDTWAAGLGTVQVGVKWRFVDKSDAGFNVSTYPQYAAAWLPASRRRGVAPSSRAFLLPIEASTEIGAFRLDAEVGRNFVDGGPSEWVAGVIIEHACGPERACMFEIHERIGQHTQQTLLNLGTHWQLSKSLALLAAVGREFGPATADQLRALVYLGVQITR